MKVILADGTNQEITFPTEAAREAKFYSEYTI